MTARFENQTGPFRLWTIQYDDTIYTVNSFNFYTEDGIKFSIKRGWLVKDNRDIVPFTVPLAVHRRRAVKLDLNEVSIVPVKVEKWQKRHDRKRHDRERHADIYLPYEEFAFIETKEVVFNDGYKERMYPKYESKVYGFNHIDLNNMIYEEINEAKVARAKHLWREFERIEKELNRLDPGERLKEEALKEGEGEEQRSI